MNLRKLYLRIGTFLIADALLSIIWGLNCSDMCFNNSNLGNWIRLVRGICGGVLIYYNRR
jgi:hypothetical protein